MQGMDYFGALDVSVKETSVCIVDDAGIHLHLFARDTWTA
jgi:hypothetical protein